MGYTYTILHIVILKISLYVLEKLVYIYIIQ